MLSPRLNDCPECANIPSLLKKIDCKLAELGNSLYNNISYMLNKPIPAGDILQLIAYRRILTHKYCNPNYVHRYSVQMIASRVIRLTAGCVSRCNEPERCLEEPCDITIVLNPTTTSTTTPFVQPTTTSTTTVVIPTTTTTSTNSSSTTTTTSTASPTTTTTSSSSSTSTTSTSTSTSTTTIAPTTTTTTTSVSACVGGYSDAIGFPNRITGNGTMTLGSGLIISSIYTGPALLTGSQPPFTNCVGGQFLGNVGDGGSVSLNYNGGAFSLTLTYSVPQTAVKFVLAGIGYYNQPSVSEYYTFTTNQSNSVVNLLAGCNDFRVESINVVAGSYSTGNTGGNFEVTADAPFTTITISGNNPGSLAGSTFDTAICNDQLTTTTTSSSSTTTSTTTLSPTTTTTTTAANRTVDWSNQGVNSSTATLKIYVDGILTVDNDRTGSGINTGQISVQSGKTILVEGSGVVDPGFGPIGQVTVTATPTAGGSQIASNYNTVLSSTPSTSIQFTLPDENVTITNVLGLVL